MSRTLAVLAAAAALAAAGCNAVPMEKYARDLEAMKETCRQLEERNRQLEQVAEAYDRLARDYQVGKTESEMYDQIARQLADALQGLKADDGSAAMTFDPRKGAWTMGTDLLFDSGSFTISPKGQEALKKFAQAYRDQPVRFRVVGHTDSQKIARASTKEKLDTDTNLELSTKRAVAVFGQLLKLSLKDSRFVEVVGMGSAAPVSPTDLRKNRRVEIYIVRDNVKSSSSSGK
jgi:flagellar motor protein MotB